MSPIDIIKAVHIITGAIVIVARESGKVIKVAIKIRDAVKK